MVRGVKALLVLEHLIKNGSPDVVDDLRAARESEHALTTSSDSDAKEAQAISAKADGEMRASTSIVASTGPGGGRRTRPRRRRLR